MRGVLHRSGQDPQYRSAREPCLRIIGALRKSSVQFSERGIEGMPALQIVACRTSTWLGTGTCFIHGASIASA